MLKESYKAPVRDIRGTPMFLPLAPDLFERVTEGTTSWYWSTLQMASPARAGPGEIQEPESPTGLPCWWWEKMISFLDHTQVEIQKET